MSFSVSSSPRHIACEQSVSRLEETVEPAENLVNESGTVADMAENDWVGAESGAGVVKQDRSTEQGSQKQVWVLSIYHAIHMLWTALKSAMATERTAGDSDKWQVFGHLSMISDTAN